MYTVTHKFNGTQYADKEFKTRAEADQYKASLDYRYRQEPKDKYKVEVLPPE